MSNREELDRLIEAALADNKLTTKEMEVLIKKAKQLGLDEDEFIIELDAKKYKSKVVKRNELISNVLNFFKKLGLTKSILLILGIIVFISLILPDNSNSDNIKLNQFIENKDYDDAFKLLALNKTNSLHLQLLASYIPFLLESNYPDKAISSLLEYDIKGDISTNIGTEEAYNIEKYNGLLFSISSYYINNSKYAEASKVLSHYNHIGHEQGYYSKRVTKMDLSKSYTQKEIDYYNQAIIPFNVILIKAVNDALSIQKYNSQIELFLKNNLLSTYIKYKNDENPKAGEDETENKLGFYAEDKNYIKKLINEIKLN